MISHLPDRLPDESLYSLVARIGRLNRWLDPITVCKALAANQAVTSSINYSLRLCDFAHVTGNAYGSPQEIAATMTPIRLVAHLGGIGSERLQAIESGQEPFDLSLTTLIGKTSWKICPNCQAEDQEAYGISYWHRQHQLPTSFACAQHAIALERVEVRKAILHERFILPGDADGKRIKIQIPEVFANWNSIASAGAEGLNDVSAPVLPESVRQAFIVGLRQRGLMTRNGKLRNKEYMQEFSHQFGDVSLLGLTTRRDLTFDAATLVMGLEDLVANSAVHRLMLVFWLFGSWAVFKERCLWEDTFAVGRLDSWQEERNRVEKERFEKLSRQHRDACRKYKESVSNPTRREFWSESQKSMHWLLHNDQQWIDKELPMPNTKKNQNVLI